MSTEKFQCSLAQAATVTPMEVGEKVEKVSRNQHIIVRNLFNHCMGNAQASLRNRSLIGKFQFCAWPILITEFNGHLNVSVEMQEMVLNMRQVCQMQHA